MTVALTTRNEALKDRFVDAREKRTIAKRTRTKPIPKVRRTHSLQGRRRRTKSGPVVLPSNGGRAGGAAPGRVREGGTPPAQLGGMGERCKLPHRGLGLRPRSQRFLRCKTLQNYAKSAIKI